MLVLASTVNRDGDFELTVQFTVATTATTRLLIPPRDKVFSSNPAAAAMTDDQYLADALQKAANELESPASTDATLIAQAAALKGTEVLPK
jgi:hypothetical protein